MEPTHFRVITLKNGKVKFLHYAQDSIGRWCIQDSWTGYWWISVDLDHSDLKPLDA